MNIRIHTIPHKDQRYDTVGDWIVKGGSLSEIVVSETGNEDYDFMIAVHEFIEGYLCAKRGITQKQVDDFDRAYEEARRTRSEAPCGCKPTDASEPGNDRHAPYTKEHRFATTIEKQLCANLKIGWDKYEKVIDAI